MRPKTLSASAANVYELCPARFAAEVVTKAPSISGSAANLGSACHRVFEWWIYRDLYRTHPDSSDPAAFAALKGLWDEAYWLHFDDAKRYDEGWGLCEKWLRRQDWTGRTVLSAEIKESFPIETSQGTIPFNYIMDRVDRLDDGDIEVTDYKSVMFPVQPEELKVRIQPRAYALAAHRKYPDAKRIWVTFDLLRYDPVGIVFSAEECEETLGYIHALAERILADDEIKEQLNPECRFCIRKHECATLQEHVLHAGSKVAIGSPEEAVKRRAELDFAKKGIEAQIRELDELIIQALTASGEEQLEVDGYTASLSSSRRRVVDSQALRPFLPYEVFAKISTVGVTALDEILKSGELDSETVSLIRRTISWRNGARGVTIKKAK